MCQVGIFHVPTCSHCLFHCTPPRRVWLLLYTLCYVFVNSNKIYLYPSRPNVEPCPSASPHPSCVPEPDLHGGSLLDSLQYVNNFLVMGRPKLDRIFQIKTYFICYNVDIVYLFWIFTLSNWDKLYSMMRFYFENWLTENYLGSTSIKIFLIRFAESMYKNMLIDTCFLYCQLEAWQAKFCFSNIIIAALP